MRIVSLVPSWTETLLEAGVKVVGRTRFCIHPPQLITNIPVVGGTKEVSWELIEDLKPDLILLDKEENPLEMAEECPYPFLATHVDSISSLARDFKILSQTFDNSRLAEWGEQTQQVAAAAPRVWNPQKVPGFQEWVKMPSEPLKTVSYIIWKKPWMAAGRGTYISSVLEKMGVTVYEGQGEKYPVLEEEELASCFNLFSSEPFPFKQKIEDLKALDYEGAVVDGECFSWFGIRSLRFLQKELGLSET